MKVALVYDRVNKFGGAERVLLTLHKIWPDAPLFTSVYNKKTASWANDFTIIPSFLQKFPFAQNNHELYAPLMPMVFESFNFDEFDTVISVTSESAKGIITCPKTLHLCYCLTPTRYLWSGYSEYFQDKKLKFLMIHIINYLKKWDVVASQRPDEYIAISKTVQERIEKYYGRGSKVIYPPVGVETFKIKNQKSKIKNTTQNSKFFLVVSRLVRYKKVDMVIEVFNNLGWNLKIVGVGREMRNLRKIAKKNIEFLGKLTDSELLFYYQNCQAVVFPQEEDFGIVPLEAQACGKPIVAFWGGGAAETVIEGVTGEFFYPQTAEALKEKILRYNLPASRCEARRAGDIRILSERYNPKNCRKQARKFDEEKFIKAFERYVEDKWKRHIETTFTR